MIQRLRAVIDRAVRRQAIKAAEADARWRELTRRPPASRPTWMDDDYCTTCQGPCRDEDDLEDA